MQCDRNQAYMRGNHVVILQPDKQPVQFIYDNRGKLIMDNIDQEIAREAIAHPLWGTMAYNGLLYRSTEPNKKIELKQ